MPSKSIALANRLHAECDASPAPIKYSTARRGANVINLSASPALHDLPADFKAA